MTTSFVAQSLMKPSRLMPFSMEPCKCCFVFLVFFFVVSSLLLLFVTFVFSCVIFSFVFLYILFLQLLVQKSMFQSKNIVHYEWSKRIMRVKNRMPWKTSEIDFCFLLIIQQNKANLSFFFFSGSKKNLWAHVLFFFLHCH